MFLFDDHWKFFAFQTLNKFSEKRKLFKKLERRFLVESAKIENATFSYKTPLSEANVKTNRVGSTKWTYHTGRSFASNYFIFLEILF